MSTIQACVSSKVLSKADRLFSNKLSDVFIELLQNARRAGATQVCVATEDIPQGTRITFADNGEGITDFGVLLHLGDSDWDPATASKEDPAGMGFFALLHSGVMVRSRGQQATITREGFLGKEPVEVVSSETEQAGTLLTFDRPENAAHVHQTLADATRFGALEVSLNEASLPREDFLKDALLVKEILGVRIGVYADYSWATWNFHGRVLRGERNLPELSHALLHPGGRRDRLYVRVDVKEARHIHLKLPDRTGIVEDEGYLALYCEAKIAMYEYIASLPEHSLYFRDYAEARELGVGLLEARPHFRTFFVPAAYEGLREELFPEDTMVLADAERCAIVEGWHAPAGDLDLTFLTGLHYFERLPVQPLRDVPQFKGYSWYDGIPRLHSFQIVVDGNEVQEGHAFKEVLTMVDSIQLRFVLNRGGAEVNVEWNLPFAGFAGEWGDEPVLLITKDSPWTGAAEVTRPFDLLDAAVYLAFSPNDDADADSSDTQLGDFRDSIQSAIVLTLGGTLAQAHYALNEVLYGWRLSYALREAKVSEIHLRRRVDGGWDPELVVSPAAGALEA
jgi:hypothetical protein